MRGPLEHSHSPTTPASTRLIIGDANQIPSVGMMNRSILPYEMSSSGVCSPHPSGTGAGSLFSVSTPSIATAARGQAFDIGRIVLLSIPSPNEGPPPPPRARIPLKQRKRCPKQAGGAWVRGRPGRGGGGEGVMVTTLSLGLGEGIIRHDKIRYQVPGIYLRPKYQGVTSAGEIEDVVKSYIYIYIYVYSQAAWDTSIARATGYRHGTVMVPSWYRHGTVVVPSWYRHGTVMVPSWYRHGTVMVPSWYRHVLCETCLTMRHWN